MPQRIRGYYRFSRKDADRNPDSHNSQIYRLKKAMGELIDTIPGEIPNEWIYMDELSGRRNDRPNFQKLIGEIESGDLDIVVVRLDRLSRNAGMFRDIADLFQTTNTKLFETIRQRFINFSNPDEWAEFQIAGIGAEKESRVTAKRVADWKEFMRLEGKCQGGRMPYGYRRSAEGKYEVNPEQKEKLLRMVEIFLNEGNFSPMLSVRIIFTELGIKMSYNGFHKLLQNPIPRGHTAYYGKDRDKKANRTPSKLIPNTHEAIIDSETADRIDMVLKRESTRKGRTKRFPPKPLSGLLFCARCGSICYPETRLIYCKAYKRGHGCSLGQERPGRGGNRPKVSAYYKDAEAAVIEALMSKAKEIAARSNSKISLAESFKEPDEVIKLREKVRQLEAIADDDDEDLQRTIRIKRKQIKEILDLEIPHQLDKERQEEILIKIIMQLKEWDQIPNEQKYFIYHKLVDKVFCCGTEPIRVELKL